MLLIALLAQFDAADMDARHAALRARCPSAAGAGAGELRFYDTHFVYESDLVASKGDDGLWRASAVAKTLEGGGCKQSGRTLTADQSASLDRLLADPKLMERRRPKTETTPHCGVSVLELGHGNTGKAVIMQGCQADEDERLQAVLKILRP